MLAAAPGDVAADSPPGDPGLAATAAELEPVASLLAWEPVLCASLGAERWIGELSAERARAGSLCASGGEEAQGATRHEFHAERGGRDSIRLPAASSEFSIPSVAFSRWST